MRPRLAALALRADPAAWSAAGFSVADSICRIGTTDLSLSGGDGGFTGWTLATSPHEGVRPLNMNSTLAAGGNPHDLSAIRPEVQPEGVRPLNVDSTLPGGVFEGVPTLVVDEADERVAPPHPNGISAIDHVVLATPDTARTFAALEAAGFALRRVRDAGAHRQGFFLFADALLEVVGPPEPAPAPAAGPAALWGVTFVCDDLDAAARHFGTGRLGAPRDAVQPGRRIAIADRAAGLGVRVALMSPRG
jgi:hypothetical protein